MERSMARLHQPLPPMEYAVAEERCDLIILGGGLAGLSLAAALAELGADCPSTVIIEPRPSYVRDRTWSYWRLHGHRFDECVRRRWHQSLLRARGRSVTVTAMDYETIEADRFYEVALDRIESNNKISIRMGCAAIDLVPAGQPGAGADEVMVQTDQSLIRARLCLDTRPPHWGQGRNGFLEEGTVQSFAGLEVETAEPVFNPDQAILMDFMNGTREKEVRFFYVLPFSERRALVEDTRFTPEAGVVPPQDGLEAEIRSYLGCSFQVHYREQACLPMIAGLARALPDPAGRILPLGMASGALRPSSGYGFLAIQRQVDTLVAAIVAHGIAPEALARAMVRRPGWMEWMDRVFLDVLYHNADKAPDWFLGMFERASQTRAIRFMADTGSLVDAAAVAAAMPKPPFLRAAARVLYRQARGKDNDSAS